MNKEININAVGRTLEHFWSKCVGAGRANEGLRMAWQNQLKRVKKECGFEYIRFHGLFHDDMCVYRVISGEEIFNFQYIDELFDALLEIGVRPFVELGFMPVDMASGETTQFWWKGNVTPPVEWKKWETLIDKTVRHFIERYGIDEVRRWYFEVWNEPNLHNGFWTGGKSGYFRMYKVSVQCIKAIDKSLRVGGPVTSNYVPDARFDGEFDDKTKHMTHKLENLDDGDWQPVWVKDFIDYCEKEQLPVDFISTHPYPTDFALDGHGETRGKSRNVNSTFEDLSLIRNIIDESPYKDAEIHLTEWSSSPSSRDHSHDFPPAAAFVVKANIESRGLVNSLSYWTFTDIFEEVGAGNRAFHGGFGMINYQGVIKPSFYAYKFLNSIGDIEIGNGENYIVTKDDKTGKCSILAYNYRSNSFNCAVPMTNSFESAEQVAETGAASSLKLTVNGFTKGTLFSVESVDKESGCAMDLYKKMGYPSSPNHEEIRLLKSVSESIRTDIILADDDGVLNLDIKMNPWEIMLIKEL